MVVSCVIAFPFLPIQPERYRIDEVHAIRITTQIRKPITVINAGNLGYGCECYDTLRYETRDPNEILNIIQHIPATIWASMLSKNSFEGYNERYHVTLERKNGNTEIDFTESDYGFSGRTPQDLLVLARSKIDSVRRPQHE